MAGTPIRRAIAVMARGGFKTPRLVPKPSDPNAAMQLALPPTITTSAATPVAGAPPAGVSPKPSPPMALPRALPGGGLPGVLEAVVVGFDLQGSEAQRGEQYRWVMTPCSAQATGCVLFC